MKKLIVILLTSLVMACVPVNKSLDSVVTSMDHDGSNDVTRVDMPDGTVCYTFSQPFYRIGGLSCDFSKRTR